MSKRAASKRNHMKERAIDIVKDILGWILVTALAFVYWMALLLVFSLILLNVWHVTFEEILNYSIVLTIITSIAYLGRMIYRRLH